MSDTYTVTRLFADQALRRKLAGEVLATNVSPHKWDDGWIFCLKCGGAWIGGTDPWCPIPDPATGSEADIAQQLLRKIVEADLLCELEEAAMELADLSGVLADNTAGFVNPYRLYVCMESVWQIICCLVALGKARIEP